MKKHTLTLFMAIGLKSTLAISASGVGNGGGIHQCPGKAPEMYDIYEGKKRYKLDIINRGESYEDVLSGALKKINSFNATLAQEIKKEIEYFHSKDGLSLESNVKIHEIEDANILMVDKGCRYTQLANWDNVSQRIFVDKDIYDQMDDLNRAALSLHEAIYSVSRKRLNVTNSDLSRKIVAEILSEEKENLSLHSMTRPSDVLTSRSSELESITITSMGVFEENSIRKTKSETFKLRLHSGDMDIASVSNMGRMLIKLPDLIAAEKELRILEEELNRFNNRKERKKIQAKIIQINKNKENIWTIPVKVIKLDKDFLNNGFSIIRPTTSNQNNLKVEIMFFLNNGKEEKEIRKTIMLQKNTDALNIYRFKVEALQNDL